MNCLENIPNCKAMCCQFIAQTLSPHADKELVDYYKMREGVIVKQQNGYTLVVTQSRCKNLSKKGECLIYDKRPPTCKDAYNKDTIGSVFMPNCIHEKSLFSFDVTQEELDENFKK